MQLQVEVLNHASVLLRCAEMRLLCDPWLLGTAFAGGWGRYYDNPEALDVAAEASHLWISHWHSDHMHEPSLRALAKVNPNVRVLVNESANFSMAARMYELGFRHLMRLGERTRLHIAPSIAVTRYPTAGIDNMLHVQAHGWSVLNYNDCNLRPAALSRLAQKLGRLDVALAHYNHAGKLFESTPPETEKLALWDVFGRVTRMLSPRYMIPFASSHYYRSVYSREQNASLLSFDEIERLATGDPRMLVMRVGDTAVWEDRRSRPQLRRRVPALPREPELSHDYGDSVPWPSLVEIAAARCSSLQRGFPGVGFVVRPLRVLVTDYGRILQLDLRNGVSDCRSAPHVAAHSKAISDWLGRPFGDDTFIAGAHFAVCGDDLATTKHWVALCLLHASRMCVPDLLRYLSSNAGRWFLWSRREEILATIAAGGFGAGELRS